MTTALSLPSAATVRNGPPLANFLASAGRGFTVQWARSPSDIRAAQRLRYQVFCLDMGARIGTPVPGHDVDRFDDHCQHLLIREPLRGQVVGTYRMLLPEGALKTGSYYSEQEFDLSALHAERPYLVEIGRSCVHPDYRQGRVLMALWSALAAAFIQARARFVIGCASIAMIDGGHSAVRIWHDLQSQGRIHSPARAHPWNPLPLDRIEPAQSAHLPPLIRAYMTMGAQVLGTPAWDPDFNVADLPLLLSIDTLPRRYRSA